MNAALKMTGNDLAAALAGLARTARAGPPQGDGRIVVRIPARPPEPRRRGTA